MTLTILGLIEIGAILANPLGPNKEAFAICHFVNYACSASREIVATDRAPTLTPRMPPEPTVRTESKMDKSVRAEGSDMSAATASPSATDHDLEATIEELKQLVSEQAATRITFPRTSVHRLPWAHTPTWHTPSPAHRASRSSSLASTFFAPRVTNYHKIIMPSSPDCACSTAGNDPQGYAGAGHPVQDGGKPGSEEQVASPPACRFEFEGYRGLASGGAVSRGDCAAHWGVCTGWRACSCHVIFVPAVSLPRTHSCWWPPPAVVAPPPCQRSPSWRATFQPSARNLSSQAAG